MIEKLIDYTNGRSKYLGLNRNVSEYRDALQNTTKVGRDGVLDLPAMDRGRVLTWKNEIEKRGKGKVKIRNIVYIIGKKEDEAIARGELHANDIELLGAPLGLDHISVLEVHQCSLRDIGDKLVYISYRITELMTR